MTLYFRPGMYVLDFELYVCRDLVKDSLCSGFLENKKVEGGVGGEKTNMKSFLAITGTSALIYK